MFSLLLAISLLNAGRDGISLAIDGDRTEIDPGRSVFLSVTLKYPKDVTASIPDLRGRVRGFSLAEDFAERGMEQVRAGVVAHSSPTRGNIHAD